MQLNPNNRGRLTDANSNLQYDCDVFIKEADGLGPGYFGRGRRESIHGGLDTASMLYTPLPKHPDPKLASVIFILFGLKTLPTL